MVALYIQTGSASVKPGELVVIDAEGPKDLSCIRERLLYFYKLKGALGIIIDGAVRDVRGI